MPKIIDNVRKKLLDEARKQILKKGYSAVTVRSVASACNIGVGTVYNLSLIHISEPTRH